MSAKDPKPLGRVAILGDVHTEAETVAAVLEHLASLSEPVDAVLCVGDIVDGQGSLDGALDALREGGVVCVAGNHERWFLAGEMRNLHDATPIEEIRDDNRSYMASMPPLLRLTTVAGGAMLCHGVGDDDMSFLRPDTRGYDLQIAQLRDLMLDREIAYMIAGHTHQRMVRRFQGLVVINAGTLRRDDSPGYVLVDFGRMQVDYYDIADLGGTITHAETLPLPEPLPLPPGYDEL